MTYQSCDIKTTKYCTYESSPVECLSMEIIAIIFYEYEHLCDEN